MSIGPPVLVQGIDLRRIGDYAVVTVEFPNGKSVEIIREYYDSMFGHHFTEHGLAAAAGLDDDAQKRG
jgi:formate-dependent nitrite reductase cytochrome c552 subunit